MTAESGQPTVLAKPAIKVMPVIGERAARPYSPASVAKAASYSPMDIPTPSSSQPATSTAVPGAAARVTSPAAITRFDTVSTSRPPRRSISRPAQGPSTAESTSDAEKQPNTQEPGMPSSRAIGTARIAGR